MHKEAKRMALIDKDTCKCTNESVDRMNKAFKEAYNNASKKCGCGRGILDEEADLCELCQFNLVSEAK